MATGHDANVSPSKGFVPSSRPITADEFFAFPSEGKRFELVAGEVTEMAVGVPTQRGTQAALVRDAPGSRRRMYRGGNVLAISIGVNARTAARTP